MYGYVRVSTTEQNEDRQMAAMTEKGIDNKNFILINNRERTLTDRSI